MALKITGKLRRGSERLGALGKLPNAIKDRQQIDISERELIFHEITGPGDRLVKDTQLLPNGRHNSRYRLPVRPSPGGLRGDIRENICADEGGIDHRVDEGDPLLGKRGATSIGREQLGAGEAAIE